MCNIMVNQGHKGILQGCCFSLFFGGWGGGGGGGAVCKSMNKTYDKKVLIGLIYSNTFGYLLQV